MIDYTFLTTEFKYATIFAKSSLTKFVFMENLKCATFL